MKQLAPGKLHFQAQWVIALSGLTGQHCVTTLPKLGLSFQPPYNRVQEEDLVSWCTKKQTKPTNQTNNKTKNGMLRRYIKDNPVGPEEQRIHNIQVRRIPNSRLTEYPGPTISYHN